MFIVIPIILYSYCIYGAWIQSNTLMPRDVDGVAVGFYEDEVYIFGGELDPQQIIRYNFDSGTFVDEGTNILPVDVMGVSQSYHQSGNILYFVHSDSFAIYNFTAKQFNTPWMNIVIPTTVTVGSSERSCLVATDEYLFVIGGSSDNKALKGQTNAQILYLPSYEWISTHMNVARNSLACAIDTTRNKLYAIGGNHINDYVFLDSIEVIDTTHIEQQNQPSWTILNDRLTEACYGSRAVAHEGSNSIFVIGGYYMNDREEDIVLDTVHIINTISNQVSLSSDVLPYSVSTTGATIINNILYCFGGWNPNLKSTEFDTWVYYIIATYAPSNEPSVSPTNIPTNVPTLSPQNTPTNIPSISPINMPSLSPQNKPTTEPTNIPTVSSTTSIDTSFATELEHTHETVVITNNLTHGTTKDTTQASGNIATHTSTYIGELDDEIIDPKKEDILLNILLVIVGILTLISVVVCCIFGGYFLKKRKSKKQAKCIIGSVSKKSKIHNTNAVQTNPRNKMKSMGSMLNESQRAQQTETEEDIADLPVTQEGEAGEEDNGENVIYDAFVHPKYNINIGNDDEIIMGDEETTTGGNY